MPDPNAFPALFKDNLLLIDQGLPELTPVGLIISSGTLISGALNFQSLVGDIQVKKGDFSESLTISGIPVNLSSFTGGGTSDHSSLINLDFNNSGHTGFASQIELVLSSGSLQTQIENNFTSLVLASGSLQSQIDNISVDEIEPAIVGSNGITIVSGSTTQIEGFKSEFLAASGFLSAEIDSDINLHIADSGAHHVRYTDAEAIAALQPVTNDLLSSGIDNLNLIITTSGSLQTQIDTLEVQGSLANALVGNDGITVISGSSFDVIEGFRSEFITASGLLQSQINLIDNHARYTDSEAIVATEPFRVTLSGHLQSQIDSIDVDELEPAIVGSDGITVVSGLNTISIQGFKGEFLAASGSLSSEIDSDIASHAADASAHHLRYTDSEAISATESARNTLSGTLSSEIDSDISVHTLNTSAHHVRYLDAEAILATEASRFTLSGTLSAEIDADIASHSLDSSAHHTRYTDAEAISALQPTTDSLQNQINAIEVDEIENALVGSDGITIVSGTSFDTIQGFRGEFLAASGFLSAEVDSDIATHTADASAHHSRYTDQEAINATDASRVTLSGHLQSEIDSIVVDEIENSLVGTDGITVISGSSFDTIQGFRPEFLAASGFVQNQVDSNFADIINLQASGVALSSDIASLQQEDLTFVKTDGSRDITGTQRIIDAPFTAADSVAFASLVNLKNNSAVRGLELIQNVFSAPQLAWQAKLSGTDFVIHQDSKDIFKIVSGASADSIIINNNGNVGIGGIPSSSTKLSVTAPFSAILRILATGATGGSRVQLASASSSTGDMGIEFMRGVLSPWYLFIDDTNEFFISRNNGTVLPFRINSSSLTDTLVVSSGTQVGIGTPSPERNLDVIGTGRFSGILDAQEGLTVSGTPVVLTDGSTPITGSQQIDGNVGIGTIPSAGVIGLLVNRNDNTSAARINAGGSGFNSLMQIESLNANALLEFRQGNQTQWSFRSDGANNFQLRNAALDNVLSVTQAGSLFLGRATNAEGSVGITQAGVERWRLAHDTGSGFLFIGSDNTGFQPQVVVEDTAPVNTLRVGSAGLARVGINQPNPLAGLHVNSDTRLDGFTLINAGLQIDGANPFIAPRLTSAQRNGLSPGTGWTIFNTDRGGYEVFNGFNWTFLSANTTTSAFIQEPVAGDAIAIITRATDSEALLEAFAFTGAGSLTYTVRIDGVNVTGLVGQTASTTTRTTGRTVTGANLISPGALVEVVIVTVSSAEGFGLSVRGVAI